MSTATVLGYPRQGPDRRLKRLIESHWAGRLSATELLDGARDLRRQRRHEMADRGLDELPSNDFSLYDHVLDTAVMLGAIPARHRAAVPEPGTDESRLARYFAMARGTADVEPLEMTKWFDTNYHYLVPELGPDTEFSLDATKPIGELAEATADGFATRPVILGPVTFLLLAKPEAGVDPSFTPLDLLDRLLPRYVDLLARLHAAGAQWVQLDEPALVLDQPADVLAAVARSCRALAAAAQRPKLLVATYFDRLGAALPVLVDSPVDGLALDLTGPAAANLPGLATIGGLRGKRLVAGVVDGRNVWRTDLTAALTNLGTLLGLADRVDVAASCSLLHVPLDVADEKGLDPQVAPWFAFARQKLDEIALLARGLSEGRDSIAGDLQRYRTALAGRAGSPITRDPAVRARVAAVTDADTTRSSAYIVRADRQRTRLDLPALPTTTIGSFPQTRELRKARADLRAGRLDDAAYREAMRAEIASVIAEQERLGLDVLVHGEPERNDMVQYFAEQLTGYVTTDHGWVQSYGTRYVRPPILVGDVSRPAPMTVEWTRYAQGLTDRPVKGMLTGPITMLAWSFVRDDQPLAETATQVALALRDEVLDLEAAGTAVIQVDEPALRETVPLRLADRGDYLDWAVRAFRLTVAGVADHTQIHTHMCYADFGDILPAIVDLDADVISLEASRSDMSITRELTEAAYPNEVGPGVWDIHSPRVPSVAEIEGRLRDAVAAFPAERLWVNPDCGLKTRAYPETLASLANLVEAAGKVRAGA
jgi:5-methyltetrahydropteroyltriglutamate--homocysteine methyltransferase